MTDELEWIKIKLIKMAVIAHMTADIRHQYEKMGLFETRFIMFSKVSTPESVEELWKRYDV